MGETANEAIMVLRKSHLSLKATANKKRLHGRRGKAGDRARIDSIGLRGRVAEMRDAKSHQPN